MTKTNLFELKSFIYAFKTIKFKNDGFILYIRNLNFGQSTVNRLLKLRSSPFFLVILPFTAAKRHPIVTYVTHGMASPSPIVLNVHGINHLPPPAFVARSQLCLFLHHSPVTAATMYYYCTTHRIKMSMFKKSGSRFSQRQSFPLCQYYWTGQKGFTWASSFPFSLLC